MTLRCGLRAWPTLYVRDLTPINFSGSVDDDVSRSVVRACRSMSLVHFLFQHFLCFVSCFSSPTPVPQQNSSFYVVYLIRYHRGPSLFDHD